VIWVDPELTLQNYCADCHGAGTHGVTFATNACRACHSMSLSPLDEDHASTINGHMSVSGGFQLAGAHEALACGMCHDLDSGEPLFSPADYTDCISCHQSEYERQHAGSDFPTTCLACHNMSSWTDVTFDHGAVSGGFALVGTHQTLACTACHDAATGEPLYDPAGQDDCYACHQGDYQSEHAGSGYPTTCLTCHSTSGWGGASFNHDSQYFRIFSGTHAGRWASCTTCHTNSNNYSEFTCFACHAHNQTDMDSEHSSVSGYNYDSQQCRACHPNV
jgi:hypothetical protein